MAGVLPGVEAARRRRFHQSSSSSNLSCYESSHQTTSTSSRRPSLCLYASSTSFKQRNPISQVQARCDESRLDAEASEAKKRLDERLQAQWRSETNRTPTTQERHMIQVGLQKVESKLKRSVSNWLKSRWKWSEQEECAVCLEQFQVTRGRTLMQLACAHKFHTNCLVPWLEDNGHCPCCRMEVTT
ncbi:hypothetical protein ACJIZ3_025307 [Penstemon smallii]|uniref:RING-type domain-containing protein n=1 Tax=Penstemon smallii TaxID=265156 RepID=A0ABD3TVL6_9LAMI